MRPPAKVQECQSCRSKNVQDWRGGQYLCKRCLRRTKRDDRGDDGSKGGRQQLVGAPTRESTPFSPPLSGWTYYLHTEPDKKSWADIMEEEEIGMVLPPQFVHDDGKTCLNYQLRNEALSSGAIIPLLAPPSSLD